MYSVYYGGFKACFACFRYDVARVHKYPIESRDMSPWLCYVCLEDPDINYGGINIQTMREHMNRMYKRERNIAPVVFYDEKTEL